MDIKELKQLAVYAAKGTAPANYSNDNVEAALLDGLRELGGSVNQFMKNRYDIYEIMIEAAEEVVPKKVIAALAPFAEVQTVAQGQKAVFTKKMGKMRAKKFLTQVGLSGVYETFRLDRSNFELAGHAVGSGATLDFERILDGAESMADIMEVMTEGLTDSVYLLVQKTLKAALNAKGRPNANKVIENTFDSAKMFKLVSVVKAYGNGAVIFAPPEFVGEMGPDAIVPVSVGTGQGIYSPDDIEQIHKTGYINIFRGTPIVQIPQSFVDENNEKTWIDPQMAYVLPTGGEKVVKVVLEGQTQMWDRVNHEQSIELYWYKKMGAAVLCNYNWGIYQNTGIPQTFESPYGI